MKGKNINKSEKHIGTTIQFNFLITKNNKICPIEVKSSGFKVYSSLNKFLGKHAKHVSNKIVIVTKDYHKEKEINYLPVYYTQ